MKTATIKLKSWPGSPYAQNGFIQEKKEPKETHEDFERRTWDQRMHVNKEGYVFIPATAFKNCLSECAKFLSIQIPGKGKATYTKHFEAGVMVTDNPTLNVKASDVEPLWIPVPPNGKRGSGGRVVKGFPTIPEWETELTVHIIDDTISKNVFEDHLKQAGTFIGIGNFRPRNNGTNGRFIVEGVSWQ